MVFACLWIAVLYAQEEGGGVLRVDVELEPSCGRFPRRGSVSVIERIATRGFRHRASSMFTTLLHYSSYSRHHRFTLPHTTITRACSQPLHAQRLAS